MTNMTVPIPDDLKALMARYRDVSWPEVARHAIAEKARVLARMDELASASTLTEGDAVRIGRQIKRRVLTKHR